MKPIKTTNKKKLSKHYEALKFNVINSRKKDFIWIFGRFSWISLTIINDSFEKLQTVKFREVKFLKDRNKFIWEKSEDYLW